MLPDADTPTLNAAFCSNAKEKLVFHPETVAEAQLIVRQLQEMGFRYYKPEYAEQLAGAVRGCIYLDTDKTIMVSDNRSSAGIRCSADGFDNLYLPVGAGSPGLRLAPDQCRTETLVFYPRTVGEARGIMRVLRGAGVELAPEAQVTPPAAVSHAVLYGMLVRGGKLSFGPSQDDLAEARICSGAALGVNAGASLSAEQATIMAAFNELNARLQQMSARVEALEKEVLPGKMDKPRLKTPGGAP